MSVFSDYEKHHLHTVVPKRDEVDNKLAIFKTQITTQIQTSIKSGFDSFKVELQKKLIEFRNEQIRCRIGRRTLTIPKTNYTWIPLLSTFNIDGVTTLQDVIIQNVYIRRNDRYHHAKSDLVASIFEQLEFFLAVISKITIAILKNTLPTGGWSVF